MSTLSVRPRAEKIDRKARRFGEGLYPEDGRPRRFEPTDVDRAWDLGFYLGRNGIAGLAPTDWDDVRADAFYDGVGAGERKREEDELAELGRGMAVASDAAGREWEW